MRTNSLALRLFLSATVWTGLILLVTGFALSGLYRNSVERGHVTEENGNASRVSAVAAAA